MNDDAKRYEKVDLRLPYGLRAKVRADGEQNYRSLNAHVVYLVETGIGGYGPADIAKELKAIRAELAELKQLIQSR